MSAQTEFFLNSESDVIQFECIELSHPNFSKVYRIVRNSIEPLTVTLETFVSATFEYYPIKITPSETSDNLEFSIQIEFGDVGEVIPNELELVITGNGFGIKPTFKYRTYRSDNLTVPLYGPLVLEIQSFTMNRTGAAFEARAPKTNINATGKVYTIDKFPCLRAFL